MSKEFVDESTRDQSDCDDMEAPRDAEGTNAIIAQMRDAENALISRRTNRDGKKETVLEARARIRQVVDSWKAPEPENLISKPETDWTKVKWAQVDKAAEHCNVHKPSHYQILPGVEVIDVRKALFKKIPEGTTPFAIDAYSRSWEYLTRMWGKNGLEDAKKARVYLDWLIEEMEKTLTKV